MYPAGELYSKAKLLTRVQVLSKNEHYDSQKSNFFKTMDCNLDHVDKNMVHTVIQCGLRSHVENICFNSDASIFASFDEEGLIKLWDLRRGLGESENEVVLLLGYLITIIKEECGLVPFFGRR